MVHFKDSSQFYTDQQWIWQSLNFFLPKISVIWTMEIKHNGNDLIMLSLLVLQL